MSNKNYNKMYDNSKDPVTVDVTTIDTKDPVEVVEPAVQPDPEIIEPAVTEPENPVIPAVEKEEPETKKAVVHNCAKLNVRERPFSNAGVLTTINAGEEVTIVDESTPAKFYSVITNNDVKGYCVKDYLKMK